MNTLPFNLPDALFQTLLGQLAQEVTARLRPPGRVSDWLRSLAARSALAGALLAALADAGERSPQARLPLFDAAFVARSGTVEIAAGLLRGESRAAVEQALLAAWQSEFAAPAQADVDAGAETAALFVEALAYRLADVPPFQALLAYWRGEQQAEGVAALAQAVEAQAAAQQRENAAIRAGLERLEALGHLRGQTAPFAEGEAPRLLATLAPPQALVHPGGEAGLFSQQPLAAGSRLYTGAGEDRILAYDLAGERLLWAAQLPAQHRPPPAFALWRDFLLVAPQQVTALDGPKALLFLERATGTIARSIPLPANWLGAPVVEGDRAWLVGNDGALYALDLARGELLWRLPDAAAFSPHPPALAAGRLYLPGSDSFLTAVDAQTPRLLWRVQAEGSMAHFFASPLALKNREEDGEEDTVYAANRNGSLYALDGATGQSRWRWDSPVPADPNRLRFLERPPVPAGELLLVASYDHHLYAIDRRSGATRWRSPDLGRRIYSRPALVGDAVYVGPFRRELHAFRLSDGAPLWPAPLTLPDRLRGDLVQAGDRLVLPLRKEGVALLRAAAPLEAPEALLARGDWQAGAARLVQLGRHAEAAQLYAAHGLLFLAAQQHEKAGDRLAAAQLYSRDEWSSGSWRRAAGLYRRLGRLADAAHILAEKLGDWPNAAQAWEEAGEPGRAAAIYAEKLGEEERAARLYLQANQPDKAANIYENLGNFTQAVQILEEADDPVYDRRIAALHRRAIRDGNKESLQRELARMTDPTQRAELYADAQEWTQAAEEWLAAGAWQRAVDLLLKHGHGERALALLAERNEHAAQTRRASLLVEEKRWREALAVYEELSDLAGQAQAQASLGQNEAAARLWMEAGAQAEAPFPTPELRARLAGCYAAAARLFRSSYRWEAMQEARRKSHYHRGWPWLVVEAAGRAFTLHQRNVLELTVHNDGGGPAAQVEVILHAPEEAIRFFDLRPLPGVAVNGAETQLVQMTPREAGEITVTVELRWQNPDGRLLSTRLEKPWIVQVVDPAASPPGGVTFHSQGDVHYYSGSVGSVVHGDQTNISRTYGAPGGGERSRLGWRCPHCNKQNGGGAVYCDGCGEKRG